MLKMLNITSNDYKVITFSGGEQHIELNKNVDIFNEILMPTPINIIKRVQTSADVMDILLLVEILRRKGAEEIHLTMPYIPYARQDRATTPESARALKVFGDLINTCGFKSVTAIDPHSMVSENVINNLKTLDVKPNLHKFFAAANLSARVVLVSPDIGALKKVESYAMSLGIKGVMVAHKERDPSTGEIKNIRLIGDAQHDEYTDFVVVDDICDGGRTFIELVKVLPTTRRSLSLFVTHGIFSRGLEPLFAAGFDKIGCTDSFKSPYLGVSNDKLIEIKLNLQQ